MNTAGITPTVGRKVWFFADELQPEPMDATIIKVHGAGPHADVNLDVIDPDDGTHLLVSDVSVGDERTQVPHYRWMPYQQAQAAKAEAAGPGAATGTRRGELNYEGPDHGD